MADASETSSTAVAGCRNASKAAKAANGRGWRGELKKARRRAHVKALGRKRDDAELAVEDDCLG